MYVGFLRQQRKKKDEGPLSLIGPVYAPYRQAILILGSNIASTLSSYRIERAAYKQMRVMPVCRAANASDVGLEMQKVEMICSSRNVERLRLLNSLACSKWV